MRLNQRKRALEKQKTIFKHTILNKVKIMLLTAGISQRLESFGADYIEPELLFVE